MTTTIITKEQVYSALMRVSRTADTYGMQHAATEAAFQEWKRLDALYKAQQA